MWCSVCPAVDLGELQLTVVLLNKTKQTYLQYLLELKYHSSGEKWLKKEHLKRGYSKAALAKKSNVLEKGSLCFLFSGKVL